MNSYPIKFIYSSLEKINLQTFLLKTLVFWVRNIPQKITGENPWSKDNYVHYTKRCSRGDSIDELCKDWCHRGHTSLMSSLTFDWNQSFLDFNSDFQGQPLHIVLTDGSSWLLYSASSLLTFPCKRYYNKIKRFWVHRRRNRLH